MTDTIKIEDLPPEEDCGNMNVKIENVEMWLEPQEEITVTKTEVKEELSDFNTPGDPAGPEDMQLTHISHNVFLPEHRTNFKCETNLDIESMGLKNCASKEEIFAENNYKFETCLLENREGMRKNYYEENPHPKNKLSKKVNRDEVGTVCGFCNIQITDPKTYGQHVIWCERNYLRLTKTEGTYRKTLKCDKCTYTAKSKFYLQRHLHTHLSNKRFKEAICECDSCEFTTMNENHLRFHVLTKHGDNEKNYRCTACKFSAESEEVLVRHMHIHTNEKPFQCKTHEFTTKHDTFLKEDVVAKHSDEEKKYKCPNCEYSTSKRGNLLRHVRNHIDEKPFQCDMCEYAANHRTLLKDHMLTKHSDKEKQHKCRECKYSTHRKGDLATHMRRLHGNQQPFKCDVCEYATNQRIKLKRHMLANHTDVERKHKCRYCKYSTNRKGDLARHTSTHVVKKPFECDACEYSANQKSLLINHMLIKHSNEEKKHKCNYCKYSTHIKGNLTNHVRIHTKEKPYKCHICEFAAIHSHQVKKHILANHIDEDKK